MWQPVTEKISYYADSCSSLGISIQDRPVLLLKDRSRHPEIFRNTKLKNSQTMGRPFSPVFDVNNVFFSTETNSQMFTYKTS